MMLPIQITSDNEPGMEIAEALLDSGASGKFIDENYARDIHVEKKDLRKPIKVYNVDGTPNKQGTITQYALSHNPQTKMETMTSCHRIRKTTNYFGIPMAQRDEPFDRFGKRNLGMEEMEKLGP